jgi:tetratricopeptide (TPR) repeat protein
MNSRRQPQRHPPPITFGAEPFEGAVVLEEFSGSLALLLWKTVRSVRLWAELPPEERRQGFSDDAFASRSARLRGSGTPADLTAAMEVAAHVLLPDVDPAAVAEACRALAQWADEQGSSGTALELLQAAALAAPGDASLAHAVARLARGRAEYGRAETWYRAAIAAARLARDWEVFARSWIGLGTVHVNRGNHPAAKKALIRGLRAARRNALGHLVAAAYHDLAMVGILTDRARDTVKYSRAALEAYGPGHPRLPALAHDVAVYWMNRGYFSEALKLFRAIPPFQEPTDQLGSASSLVRAAAGAGDRDTYRAAWRDAVRLLRNPATRRSASLALVEMARGAGLAGEWERAQESAERAYHLARERGEAQQVVEAESVMDWARAGGRSGAAPDQSASRRPPREVEQFSRVFASALAGAEIG